MKYLLILLLVVSLNGFSQAPVIKRGLTPATDSAFYPRVIGPGDTIFYYITDVPFAFFITKVVVIPINANATANLALTNHPNSEQPLANSQRSAVRINTEGYTKFRTTAIVLVSSASVNNPRIYLQYSTDAVNWIGDGSAGSISLSTTGAKETVWITIPPGAIGDIYVRAAMHGGNGIEDPGLGNITIQLR